MTTKQLAAEHRKMADESLYLWKSAHLTVAYICEKYHRSRALRMLKKQAKDCEKMAISSVFKGATNDLSGCR